MQSIAILDGAQRSALAACRSLARAGFAVHVGDAVAGIASASKLITRAFSYPDPSTDAEAARGAIARYCEQHNIDVLMPMTDVTTHLLLTADPALALPPMPCAPLDVYEHASDKGRLARTALACGVAVPRTEHIDSNTPLTALPAGFDFPVVLKPTRSKIAVEGGYLATTVMIAHTLDQFVALQREHLWFTQAPWLLQAFIEGMGQGVFTIYDNGRPLGWFAHERIREKPPGGGVSVLSRSAPLSDTLKRSAESLLNTLNWHGPAMVEYRVAHDGTPYLMEINARFWGSLQLSINAGINFPLLAAHIALQQRPAPAGDYRLGVYNRWLLGDLDNLYLTLKAPGERYSLAHKLKAIARFVLPWYPGLHYETNQWGDLGPFWYELKHYLR
ncbi:MAG: ATP-grasp domain-containing protein [Pseudomonadota bacterium]